MSQLCVFRDGTIEPNQDVPFRQNPVDTMFRGRLRRAQRKRPSSVRWSHFKPPVIKVCINLVLTNIDVL